MKNYDFAVIGGSYAGMAAALQLARARRKVLVVDAGQQRNRFVDEAGETSHGFLSQDGRAPAEIAADAREQLMNYPSVEWIHGTADDARVASDGWLAFRVGSEAISAIRLIIATGVRDELPPVPGLAERWGRSVFRCPYCHSSLSAFRMEIKVYCDIRYLSPSEIANLKIGRSISSDLAPEGTTTAGSSQDS